MNRQALEELEKRLKEASGPDREIDAALQWFVAGDDTEAKVTNADHKLARDHGAAAVYDKQHKERGGVNFRYCPPPHVVTVHVYTASIDAALALVERKLPGMARAVLIKAVQSLSCPDEEWLRRLPLAALAEMLKTLVLIQSHALEAQHGH